MTYMQEKIDKHNAKRLYRQMYLMRKFEEVASEMYIRGKISGFTHLYIGQEAIAAGVMSAIFDKDYVISAYRDHGHALAKGVSAKRVMAELFGKETGCSKGLGGSMHLYDIDKRFMGGYAIVAGGIPIAAGLGLAIDYKKENVICACFFGDGAVNQGAFHESFNLAKLWNLPVLFICENNLYAMGTAVGRATAATEIHKLSGSYGIPSECANGMNVLEVKQVTEKAAAKVRNGEGPYFLEFKTYRYKPHSMADPNRYRTIAEEEVWKERDPIMIFARQLTESGLFDSYELKEIQEDVDTEVQDAVDFADSSLNPDLELLKELVYSE